MTSAALIVSIVVAVLACVLGGAYQAGLLDSIIQNIGVMLFKAEAKAEKKKLQAQGLKEGQDFMESELKGNQQANDIKQGLGSLGNGKIPGL